MGHWTPEVLLDPIEFDGDKISVRVSRMLTEDMQRMTPYMKQEKNGDVKISFEDSMKLLEVASAILPKHVKTIDGMKLGDGSMATAERFNAELINQFYFIEFTTELLGKICEVSIVQDKDEKNSDTPSKEPLQALEETPAQLAGVK
jgi:hypothetical protein